MSRRRNKAPDVACGPVVHIARRSIFLALAFLATDAVRCSLAAVLAAFPAFVAESADLLVAARPAAFAGSFAAAALEVLAGLGSVP